MRENLKQSDGKNEKDKSYFANLSLMGVKYKKTNIAPSVTPSNPSIVYNHGPDTVGPERRFKNMTTTNNMRNRVFPIFINL